nr:MAG TPA: hypothetical protein [Caudoviricetes sp.]
MKSEEVNLQERKAAEIAHRTEKAIRRRIRPHRMQERYSGGKERRLQSEDSRTAGSRSLEND